MDQRAPSSRATPASQPAPPRTEPRDCPPDGHQTVGGLAGHEAGDLAATVTALDHRARGEFARLVGGQSPWAMMQAWTDWGYHLAISPGRRIALWERALTAGLALTADALSPGTGAWPIPPEPSDRRFRHPGWQRPPFRQIAEAHLALEAQWRAATQCIPGVDRHHARRVEFLGRFALNAFAPVNFPWTNPEVVEAVRESGGMNFAAGARLLLGDLWRIARGEQVEGLDAFRVGETMAITPGKVVFRNRLMELIQYEPATAEVRRGPILVVPAWIMKYYILDPTPPNSLVRHLVDAGFTVFMISWKNPGPELRDTSFEDYRRDGVLAAVDAVAAIVPGEPIHAVGYCLGGTVLAIAVAAMDRDGDERIASLSLFAAQTDFEEAGELMLFIDESQLSLLEDMMDAQGYLDARQMASAFYALRAHEMVFAKLVERYYLGEPAAPGDIDAWLTDATRMPARMHGEYLRQLFLDDRFAHGAYMVDGRAVALKDIRCPIFALGAERDHIAPWRSVYKIALYATSDVTFVLTGGGHNSSVVSPPGKRGAYYRVTHAHAGGDYVDPDHWLATTAQIDGSWWPEWFAWLERHAPAGRTAPPPMGRPDAGLAPLCPAPGTYVLEH